MKSQYDVRETRMQIGFGNALATAVERLCPLLEAVTGLLRRMRTRARLRRDLEHLDERLLRDIGARRSELESEAAKPFWRR